MALSLSLFLPTLLEMERTWFADNQVSCLGLWNKRSIIGDIQIVVPFDFNNVLQRGVRGLYWLSSMGLCCVWGWVGEVNSSIYVARWCLCSRTCASIVFWVIYKHHCLMLLCTGCFCFIFCSHSWILLFKRRTTHSKSLVAFWLLEKDALFHWLPNAILGVQA